MTILVENPTIGSDVEFFLRDKQTQEIISAEGLIRGTKRRPYRFIPDNEFYGMQLDNVLAEGNIPPASEEAEFVEYLQFLRSSIERSLPDNLTTEALAAARLDEKWLRTENAKTFGCDPSANCWTEDTVQPQPTGDNLRSAGFHIHIGYDEITGSTNIALAKACDLFLSVPAVLIEPANERKAVGYGCAGNFRHQNHGVEYRSLSSFFCSSPELIAWCYRNTMLAIEFVNAGRVVELDSMAEVIQDTINSENKTKALELCQQFNIPLP